MGADQGQFSLNLDREKRAVAQTQANSVKVNRGRRSMPQNYNLQFAFATEFNKCISINMQLAAEGEQV
jgi:hypothetical protein